MAENTIKARLQMKNDTEANWNKAINFIPKEGEIIIYNADENYNSPRIKIGDGSTVINDLPFVTSDNATVEIKLYNTTGNNTDGAMTQKAVTDSINDTKNDITLLETQIDDMQQQISDFILETDVSHFIRYKDDAVQVGTEDSNYLAKVSSDNGFSIDYNGNEIAAVRQGAVSGSIFEVDRIIKFNNGRAIKKSSGLLLIT